MFLENALLDSIMLGKVIMIITQSWRQNGRDVLLGILVFNRDNFLTIGNSIKLIKDKLQVYQNAILNGAHDDHTIHREKDLSTHFTML